MKNKIDVDLQRQQEKKQNSTNFIFLGCIILSLIFLFFLISFVFQKIYKSTKVGLIELSLNDAKQNAENIELFFLRHEDFLLTTAEVVEYSLKNQNTGPEEIKDFFYNISTEYNNKVYTKYANSSFTGIYAAVDGVLVHGFKTPQDLPKGYDPTKRQWYKEGVAGKGNVVFGEPYKDIYSSSLVMTATKLLSDGKTVLGMDITLDDLQFASGKMNVSILLNEKEHIYGQGFVLTNNGVVVAHYNPSEQGISYNDPSNPMYNAYQQIKECVKNNSTYFETIIDDVHYGVFPHILNNGWYIVTLTNLEDVNSTTSDYFILIAIGAFGSLVLALIYCTLLTIFQIKSQKLSSNLSNALVLAKKDELTGHKNRNAYHTRLTELSSKFNTNLDESFAIIMLDLNDLKYVNDNLGHTIGDQYIKNCCSLIHKIIPTDIYRIGGDEFVLFLTDEFFYKSTELCEKLKSAVKNGNMLQKPDINKPSIAIGMAIHLKNQPDDLLTLLNKADAEMYINKAKIKQSKFKSVKN